MTYEELEASLSQWAAREPAVRAVIVVGSRARGEPDRWSDLDTLILTTDRQCYAADPGWLSAFGGPLLTWKKQRAATPNGTRSMKAV